MPDASTPHHARWLFGVLVLLAIAVVGGLLVFGERLPTGPAPIAWNKEACAHCRMHIGEQAFAAQLQLTNGKVLSFDDPGCALKELAGVDAALVHAVYFHHAHRDGWLSRDQVGFVSAPVTPMGFGLAAVEAGTEGALSYEQALSKVNVDARAEVGHGARP